MKDRLIRFLKVFVSVLLMYILMKKMDIHEFWRVLHDSSILGIVTVVFIYIVSVCINAIKWHLVLPNTDLRLMVSLSFKAQFYSTVLPGQLFGEVSKVALWSDKNERVTNVIASVAFDRITGLIGQLLIGIVGVYISVNSNIIENKWIVVLLVLIIIALLYVSSSDYIMLIIHRVIVLIGRFSVTIGNRCDELYNAWCYYSKDRYILIKSVLLGAFNQLLGILSVWYLSVNSGIDVSIWDYCWMMPLMAIILLIPISFAGIGLRDASLATMLALFGVSAGKALVLSITLLLAQIVAAVIGAILAFIHPKDKCRSEDITKG